MLRQLKKLVRYLLGKTSELGDLDTKVLLLTKVILDIHRKKNSTAFVMTPLFSLNPIHAIDRDNALEATRKRAGELMKIKDRLMKEKNITREILAEYLPSVSWIKVVKEREGSYISYEGNGRLAAMQQVFTPEDGIMVEVEEYSFRKPAKIIRRMNRVRRMNGLIGKK
ncbi:MAG: hypothetical protein JW863_03515 [Chitinispirillaceae bacterium]|nr:hypothetical protein [Chitinispirillaceae bacterium]